MAKANNARKTPPRQRAKPMRRRKLKKADREGDFVFIGGFLFAYLGE
jgi:hypothetical protein